MLVSATDDTPFRYFDTDSPLEIVAGRAHHQPFYTVCSADGKLETVSEFRKFPSPFLSLGDFNERHPLWGLLPVPGILRWLLPEVLYAFASSILARPHIY